MILTIDELKELKWIVPADGNAFLFVGQNSATAEERKRIYEFDAENYNDLGYHIILNIDEVLA